MTQFTLICPRCSSELTLNPRRLIVRVDAGTARSGEVLFTCLNCHRSEVVSVDVSTAAHLITAGVTFLSLSQPTLAHPEPHSPGPMLSHDDLLDLHAALASDTWHEELSALGC